MHVQFHPLFLQPFPLVFLQNTSAYDPEHIVSTGVRYTGKDYQDGSDYLVGYYQWVWLVLGLQAVAFHLPYMAWKRCEGGAVTKYVAKLLKEEQDGGGDGEEREDRRCGDKKCGECGGGGDGSGADRDNGSCGGGGRARDETAEAIGRRLVRVLSETKCKYPLTDRFILLRARTSAASLATLPPTLCSKWPPLPPPSDTSSSPTGSCTGGSSASAWTSSSSTDSGESRTTRW